MSDLYDTDILTWSDDEFEAVHDFVQWLFPLPAPQSLQPRRPAVDRRRHRRLPRRPAPAGRTGQVVLAVPVVPGAVAGRGRHGRRGAELRGRVGDAWAFENHNWLRISRVGAAWALHAGVDGQTWALARFFRLDSDLPAQVGILAQSPVGDGCTVRFDQLAVVE